MNRTVLFKNYISNCHSDRVDFSKPKMREEFNYYDRNFKYFLPREKDRAILEIGFGTGYFLKYLIGNGYKNIIGIEQSKEEISYVKSNIFKNVYFVKNTNDFLVKH